MSMDRRGFFGRLFGAAVAAPLVANELAKPAPAIPASVGDLTPGRFVVPQIPFRSFPASGGTYCITMRLPVSPYPTPMRVADLSWSPDADRVEFFDSEWARVHGAGLLEGGKVERGGFGSTGQ